MSSTKDLLAKSLQKSHSSSSLLLSSANLSWTPPTSTGLLVAPQPPLETTSTAEAKRQKTNEELIQALRLDSKADSSQSIDTSDAFQTISLSDNRSDDVLRGSKQSLDSITSETTSLSKLSLNDLIFPSATQSTTSSTSSPFIATLPLIGTTPGTAATSQLYINTGADSTGGSLLTYPSYSQPSQTTTGALPVPPQPTAPPIQPPKAIAVKDFKIKGPLRLYDPNHGIQSTPGQPNPSHSPADSYNSQPSTEHSQQQQALPVPPLIPFTQPIPESLYNPSDYYTTDRQTNDLTDSQSHAYSPPQQYDIQSTIPISASEPALSLDPNTQQFSYISQTDSNYNPNNNWSQMSTEMSGQSSPQDAYSAQYQQQTYAPVAQHWFYQKIVENKEIWKPFSLYDSYNLEQAVLSTSAEHQYGYGLVIPTDGGRFDVDVYERIRRSVYWSEADTIVRRCQWFYKREGHNRWAPYPEDIAGRLEDSYRDSVLNNRWNQRIELESGAEAVVMHSAQSIYHYQLDQSMPDGWGQALENPIRPRLVHRGALDGIFDDIDEGEPQQIDHLVFLIHGVGEFCDFSFRSIVEVVDDFRWISLCQMRTHFKQYLESGQLGRIELLPISWHSALHGSETGIDDRLKLITLESIPKLRHFSNDTILDALFYTSPVYCQTIVDNVGQEMNRLFHLFCQRNPHFYGTVALGGHSLGSLIVFDILAHQKSDDSTHTGAQTTSASEVCAQKANDNNLKENISEYFKQTSNQTTESVLKYIGFPEFVDFFQIQQKLDFKTLLLLTESDFKGRESLQDLPLGLVKQLLEFIQKYKSFQTDSEPNEQNSNQTPNESKKSVNYAFESLGLGFPSIQYPSLAFKPSAFFAMGSPLPMFLTVRGVQSLEADYRLPTCPAVYNIFHPYDPIAYRLEPMIYRGFKDIKPVLIPHHKGRKRMHLELRDSIVRVGSELKNKIYDSLKYTWNSIHEFARAHKPSATTTGAIDNNYSSTAGADDPNANTNDNNDYNYDNNGLYEEQDSYAQQYADNLSIGALNSGRRIDYVLQESPVEAFNDYLFAMSAHACYWQSEDTALLILRELYGQLGYFTTVAPQQNTIPTSASINSLDGQQVFDTSDQQLFQN